MPKGKDELLLQKLSDKISNW